MKHKDADRTARMCRLIQSLLLAYNGIIYGAENRNKFCVYFRWTQSCLSSFLKTRTLVLEVLSWEYHSMILHPAVADPEEVWGGGGVARTSLCIQIISFSWGILRSEAHGPQWLTSVNSYKGLIQHFCLSGGICTNFFMHGEGLLYKHS